MVEDGGNGRLCYVNDMHMLCTYVVGGTAFILKKKAIQGVTMLSNAGTVLGYVVYHSQLLYL